MARTQSPASIQFKVHRCPPELLTPAKPTPHEFKYLSDLDNQDSFRNHVPSLHIYPHSPSMNGFDPVEVLKKAISQTLVYYYPLAGRLREDPSRKLVVECTGEGVVFIEADADVTLDQFGLHPLVPPIPCADQLLFDVPGSTDILNTPLMLIQVTRLKCGGFIFGLRFNHCMTDGAGLAQFMFAIAEMARGAASPTVLPAWERHVLSSKNPHQLTVLPDPENKKDLFKSIEDSKSPILENDLCYQTFFFGPTEISALRRHIPHHLRDSSSFETLTACVWKCRVAALEHLQAEETSMIWAANMRSKFNNSVPRGYYGNAFAFSTSKSTAKEIMENPLSYVLQLVRNARGNVVEDFAGSVKNLILDMNNYTVSDLRHAGFREVDFGWGKSAYGGPAHCHPLMGSYMPFKTENGEKGSMFPLCLPKTAMERFEQELNNILIGLATGGDHNAAKSKL